MYVTNVKISNKITIVDAFVVLLLLLLLLLGCAPSFVVRKEMFYLMTHSTHFIYGSMASDMVKDHSDSERGHPLPPHTSRLLFLIYPLSYFLFQPVLHNWCNKGCGMYYPVCGKMHIKE